MAIGATDSFFLITNPTPKMRDLAGVSASERFKEMGYLGKVYWRRHFIFAIQVFEQVTAFNVFQYHHHHIVNGMH